MIKGLTFINGYYTWGSALDLDGDNIRIDSCTFKDNIAQDEEGTTGQGTIYIDPHNNIVINNCIFEDNYARAMGGAIYNNAPDALITNCTFDNNFASNGGSITTRKNANITNNKFKSGFGALGGEILCFGSYGNIINNNSFEYSNARYGGAIMVYSNSGNNTISNNDFYCTYARGYTDSDGGAVYLQGPNNILVNNSFDRTYAMRNGGSIFGTKGAFNTTVDNCTFKNNNAYGIPDDNVPGFGGAIYLESEKNKFINSKFENNVAPDNGGAIFIRNNDNLIENCTFNKNAAGRGGAIYIEKTISGQNISNTTINNCTFNNNGRVSEQDGEPNLGTKGGAIYSWGVDTHVTNSKFNNNVAMTGGAILYERGHNYLENNTFTGNKALRYGGGAISSTRFGDTINNCTFTDNFALGYGGAVSADYPTITNSKFIRNEANHGGAICTITANVSNSEFYDNVAYDHWTILAATKLISSNNVHPNQVALSMNHTTYLEMDYDVDNEIAIMPGYYAYCMEEYADYPQYGVLWENLRFAQNSISEEGVGEYLKILIYKYWDDETHHSNLQKLVNAFTDRKFSENDDPIVQEIISLYDSGYRVPTNNALRFYENGTVAVFNFREIITPSATQNVFAFNITYNPNLTVEKEIITKDIYLNSDVDFNITVTNTGECNLTNLWINDTDFSDCLVYKSFKSSFNWTYDTESKLWILNDTLVPKESAYIILTFKVTKAGNMTNNVTSGLANITFDNDTVNFRVYAPNMTVEKISNNKNVKVGEMASFTIIVKNTGDCNLTGVYVIDNGAEGLNYDHFVDESGKWSFDGKNKWTYGDVLGISQASNFTVFFKALSEGFKVNTAVAGNNLTNDTVNSINTTNVTVEHNNKTVPENETPEKPVNETPKNSTQPQKEVKTAVENATGNPLIALLAVLLLAGVTSLRKFKK
ncbi:right-handed parallel beta-helix repeat-containing protein [uncultured Methanobrevibacter sp.]|uniref:right-handed parallel beta-helix repeat-containing protein n=1 Tax=uncultured Methanobrevibacter sp. TaxID=253161 RepID=UPI0025EC0155|nr:right-handed parallel beta-helix repeat-containing protein [uncultured Methanobrevibacter sp.]